MTITRIPLVTERTHVTSVSPIATIRVPRGRAILWIGVEMESGELSVWIDVPEDPVWTERTLLILKEGDEIPPGYVYRGSILNVPPLFVFERDDRPQIITPGVAG